MLRQLLHTFQVTRLKCFNTIARLHDMLIRSKLKKSLGEICVLNIIFPLLKKSPLIQITISGCLNKCNQILTNCHRIHVNISMHYCKLIQYIFLDLVYCLHELLPPIFYGYVIKLVKVFAHKLMKTNKYVSGFVLESHSFKKL